MFIPYFPIISVRPQGARTILSRPIQHGLVICAAQRKPTFTKHGTVFGAGTPYTQTLLVCSHKNNKGNCRRGVYPLVIRKNKQRQALPHPATCIKSNSGALARGPQPMTCTQTLVCRFSVKRLGPTGPRRRRGQKVPPFRNHVEKVQTR